MVFGERRRQEVPLGRPQRWSGLLPYPHDGLSGAQEFAQISMFVFLMFFIEDLQMVNYLVG